MKNQEEKSLFKTNAGKVVILLFIFALIIATATDLYADKLSPKPSSTSETQENSLLYKVRNLRIDSIKPNVKQNKDSIYTVDDIVHAADVVKESFKQKDMYVSLSSITFDENTNRENMKNFEVAKDYSENNFISFLCSYNVYKSHGAYSSGYYTGWNVFLARDSQSSEWTIIDQGA